MPPPSPPAPLGLSVAVFAAIVLSVIVALFAAPNNAMKIPPPPALDAGSFAVLCETVTPLSDRLAVAEGLPSK